jgi:two-component system sensor histidine kinase EvgS
MDDFLIKPVNLTELMRRFDHWLPLPAPSAPQQDIVDGERLIHSETLSAITGGDAQMVRDVLLDFVRINETDAHALGEQLRAQDLEQVVLLVHRIKGAARTVGAQRLVHCCDALEHAARHGDTAGVGTHAAALRSESELLHAYIRQAVASTPIQI